MTYLSRILPIVFIALFVACGGGGGGGGGNSEPPRQDTEAVVTSLDIEVPFNKIFRIGDPIEIEVFANYSDSTRQRVTLQAVILSSSSTVGEILTESDRVLFDPQVVGNTEISAEFDGVIMRIALEVVEDRIVMTEENLIIPLGSQFPILKYAAHFTDDPNEPDYEIWEAVTYESSNPGVAEFRAKEDNIVINPLRNTEVGHLHGLSPGTTTVTFKYRNFSESIEVEVLPYRLVTTEKTEDTPFYIVYDTVVDDQNDSFFLTGVLQLEQRLKLSHYSNIDAEWQADLDIDLPETDLYTYRTKLISGDNKLAITWPSEGVGYLIIIDKITKDYQILEVEGAPQIDAIGFDNNDQAVACWNLDDAANCRVLDTQNNWSDIQVLPAPINREEGFIRQIDMTSENEFHLLSVASGSNGDQVISGSIIESDMGQLNVLTTEEIYRGTPLGEIESLCPRIETSLSGELTCYFRASPQESLQESLHSIVYEPANGWDLTTHFDIGEYRLTPTHEYARAGVGENGERIIIWQVSSLGVLLYRRYTPTSGWGSVEQIQFNSLATPLIKHSPKLTNEGWKVFLGYANALVTINDSGWSYESVKGWGNPDDPFDENYSLGFSYDDRVAITDDGQLVMAWFGSWAYLDIDGNVYSNDLYFARPAN